MRKGKKMNRTITMVAIGVMLLIPGIVSGQVTDRIVAVVNKDIITLFELEKAVDIYLIRIGQPLQAEEKEKIRLETRNVVLYRMIEEMLIEQQARKTGIVVSDEDAMSSITDMLGRRKTPMENFKEALVREGSSFEQYKEEVKSHLMKVRLAQREVWSKISVSDEEIGEYYSKHRDAYEGEESVRLKQILLVIPPGADYEAKNILRMKAEEILKRLENGEPFEVMAANHSEGPEAPTGGDLRFVDKGSLLPQVDEAAFKLKVNELSPVVESSIGFHILMVVDRSGKGSKPLNHIRAEIHEQVANEKLEKKLQDWVQNLKNRSFVDIRL
jgi:parvulin-like peptidyl-prolyl isomerase